MTVRQTFICAILGLAFIQTTSAAQPRTSQSARDAALTIFQARVDAYVALHRQLEAPLPPPERERDPWSLFLARRYLASAIRAARPFAREGDVFTPQVRQVFREIVAEALAGRDVPRLLADLHNEDSQLPHPEARVNEAYPPGATHEVPVVLLQRLPALAGDLEYRIVNDSLVLWDSHADVVVDVLPRVFALAMETS